MTKKSLIKSALTILITITMLVGMMPSAAHASSIPTIKASAQSLSAPTPPPPSDNTADFQAKEQSLKL